MDKKLEKLKKILSKLGLDEEKQKEILDIVNSDDKDVEEDDAKIVEEEQVEETPAEESSPEGDGDAPSEEPDPVDPPEAPVEEPTPVEEPPVEESSPLPDGITEVDPNTLGDVPPEPNPEEPVPTPDVPSVDYEAKLAAQEELINAQKARIDSLEEALKKAGILDDTGVTNQVGTDDNQAPANDPIDNPVQRVLKEINGKY